MMFVVAFAIRYLIGVNNMERLTKWLNNKTALCYEVCEKECVNGYYECHHCNPFADAMKKLANYEDLEEQGRLLVLPCKVGDEFWVLAYEDDTVTHVKCTGYTIHVDEVNQINCGYAWLDSIENQRDYWKLDFKEFENQCFRTREEAEVALEKMKGE